LLWVAIIGLACRNAHAATNSTPPPPTSPGYDGQKPGEAQKILRRVTGTVQAIDLAAKKITIKSAGESHRFVITSGTKFTRDGVPAKPDDLTVGKTVECTVASVSGKLEPGGAREELVLLNSKSGTPGK